MHPGPFPAPIYALLDANARPRLRRKFGRAARHPRSALLCASMSGKWLAARRAGFARAAANLFEEIR